MVFTWRIIETVNAADIVHLHVEIVADGGGVFTRTAVRVPLGSALETVRAEVDAEAARAVAAEQARREAEAALLGLTGSVTV